MFHKIDNRKDPNIKIFLEGLIRNHNRYCVRFLYYLKCYQEEEEAGGEEEEEEEEVLVECPC